MLEPVLSSFYEEPSENESDLIGFFLTAKEPPQPRHVASDSSYKIMFELLLCFLNFCRGPKCRETVSSHISVSLVFPVKQRMQRICSAPLPPAFPFICTNTANQEAKLVELHCC